MKKLFNFMGFSILNACLYLYNKIVYAQDRFMTAYGAQTFYGVSSPAFGLGKVRVLITLIGILSAFILSLISLKRRFKKFDYKSDYKKFKLGDKIKVTFVDENSKVVTKRCRITSINGKKIIFENKTDIYECVPSDIKNIQKRSKKIFIVILTAISFLLLGIIMRLTTYSNSINYAVEMYGVPEIEDWGD